MNLLQRRRFIGLSVIGIQFISEILSRLHFVFFHREEGGFLRLIANHKLVIGRQCCTPFDTTSNNERMKWNSPEISEWPLTQGTSPPGVIVHICGGRTCSLGTVDSC